MNGKRLRFMAIGRHGSSAAHILSIRYAAPFEFTGNLDQVVIKVGKSAAGENETDKAEVSER
jgi:hypothetical protein